MELNVVLRLHDLWLSGNSEGKRADLHLANLSEANLSGANLSGANLSGADLHWANLSGANLSEVGYDQSTAFFDLRCPNSGAYRAYKKAGGMIVELLIPADALRSSATTNKCRASKAKVLSIKKEDGTNAGITKIASDYDKTFIYEVGKTVEVEDFDMDRWNECSTGIHHFVTSEEAVQY